MVAITFTNLRLGHWCFEKKFFFSRVAIVAFALYKALNQVVSLLAAGTFLKSSVYPRVRV